MDNSRTNPQSQNAPFLCHSPEVAAEGDIESLIGNCPIIHNSYLSMTSENLENTDKTIVSIELPASV
ncbi:unnamed protein product [Dracunculus medinensis]|uniref:Uncharacterized protein n=1 Tax=Dracunculus medinensis TaxID=318479 RepID=A0A0N4UEC4_DRAME|nr:unnamed protein product [Dracunculus medinensis]